MMNAITNALNPGKPDPRFGQMPMQQPQTMQPQMQPQTMGAPMQSPPIMAPQNTGVMPPQMGQFQMHGQDQGAMFPYAQGSMGKGMGGFGGGMLGRGLFGGDWRQRYMGMQPQGQGYMQQAWPQMGQPTR